MNQKRLQGISNVLVIFCIKDFISKFLYQRFLVKSSVPKACESHEVCRTVISFINKKNEMIYKFVNLHISI